MNPQDNPLAELNDILLPDSISFWPLAPGWWALILLIATTLTASLIFFTHRHRQNRFKRLAMIELSRWLQSSRSEMPAQNTDWAFINQWIKRLLFKYYARKQLSALTGEHWQHFLAKQSLPLPLWIIEQLGDALYKPVSSDTSPINNRRPPLRSDVFIALEEWLRQLPPPSSDVQNVSLAAPTQGVRSK